jgi:tRNA(adenine34) deaminase
MDDLDTRDARLMRRCFALAIESAKQGEYPYAAVIARNGQVVVESTNRVARDRDVTRHAEVVAISDAQKATGRTSLDDCVMYVITEPCAFCCYAIRESRIAKVVYGMRSPVMGGVSRWNILGDPTLSDAMPEVFAPPPDIVHDFLCDEADAALWRAAPLAWIFIRRRRLFNTTPQPSVDGVRLAGTRRSRGHVALSELLMRLLRTRFFDRFGRGGATRPRPPPHGAGNAEIFKSHGGACDPPCVCGESGLATEASFAGVDFAERRTP